MPLLARWDLIEMERLSKSKNCYPTAGFDSIPKPGEVFQIAASPDTDPKRSVTEIADHPLNWQPVAWYVDFDRERLLGTEPMMPALHGIKLVLTCLDAEPGAQCTVQDIKQIWFESEPEPMI